MNIWEQPGLMQWFLPLKMIAQQELIQGPGSVTDILSILRETVPTVRISYLGAGMNGGDKKFV